MVDDAPDICEALRVLIEETLRYSVLTAQSGPEALELLQSLRAGELNLILSDYRMVPMDGVSFLAKAREAHPDVPRVLMTAYPDQDLAIEATNSAGIVHFLRKPLHPGPVVTLVRELTSGHVDQMHRMAALRRAASGHPFTL